MLCARYTLAILAIGAVAGCQSPQTPHDSSTRVLNEMKTKPIVAAKAADSRDARIGELDRERQRLADALAAEQARRASLEGDLSGAKNRAGALEGQAGRVSDLERQLADRDRELAGLRSQLSGAASSDELARLQGQLSSRDQELASLRGQLAGAASADDLARARQDLSARDQELVGLKGQLAGAASGDDLARARQDLSARDQELASLKGQLAGAVSADELARVRQEAAAKEQELAALKGKLGGMASAEELAAAKRRIAELEKELGDRNQELARLKGSLTDEEKELARLKGDLAAQMDRLKDAQRGIAKSLRKEVEKGNILVDMRKDHLLVNLASTMLFDSGSAELKAGGRDALKSVGEILKDYPEYNVEVGGHTDNVKIQGELAKKYPTNKELSAARADAALKALQDGGMTNHVATAGYADRRPAASNATADGRQRNRRVEVKVMPK